MQKIMAFFMSIVTFILSLFGYLSPTETFDIQTLSVDSWNGKTVMFQGKEIDVTADCETVTGGKAPVFRFETDATLRMKANVKGFTYYGLVYTGTNDLKCEITTADHTDTFFLEKTKEPTTFYSYTENFEKEKNITALKLTNLNGGKAEFTLLGFSAFNRAKPADEIVISNSRYKIGVSTLYGGALSYMECLTGQVQAVKLADGTVKVDQNAQEKYGGTLLTSHVNLINRFDAGRCVQQSYYGTNGKTDGYVRGEYNGIPWPYNPVQGGNLAGEHSRIIDYRVTGNSIIVKCRPLDWAKPAGTGTSAYMEATYTLLDTAVQCDCRFIDFSGYAPRKVTQEMPAVYLIEPLNCFAYIDNGETVYQNDLAFWGDHPEQFYETDTGISGFFCGENGFGVGIYAPDAEAVKAGVFLREKENTLGSDPSKGRPTSYLAPTAELSIESCRPITYTIRLAASTLQSLPAMLQSE